MILAIFVLLILFFYVRNAASGTTLKQQILAKQIALLIDTAQPGTTLFIYRYDEKSKTYFNVDIDESAREITVSAGGGKILGYSYNFFSSHKLERSYEGAYVKIKVS